MSLDRWRLNDRGRAAIVAKASASGCYSQEEHARLLGISRTAYCNRVGGRWHKKKTLREFLRAAGIPNEQHGKLMEHEGASVQLGHLPTVSASFVGRRREIAEILSLLRSNDSRPLPLLTLTGIGGIGKTRLAMSIGERLMRERRFSDGVWWVGLQSIEDPLLLLTTFWQALRLEGQEVNEPSLLRHLSGKQLLFIVDRCEELLDSAGAFIERILQHAPGIKVLATSRRAFGLSEERVYAVEPLLLPEDVDDSEQLCLA